MLVKGLGWEAAEYYDRLLLWGVFSNLINQFYNIPLRFMSGKRSELTIGSASDKHG